jgi:hypothetical protein
MAKSRVIASQAGQSSSRWLIRGCLGSLLLYALAFGSLFDRPLAFGFLRAQIDAKLEHAAMIREPKLVILAGSNGPYSHRWEIIEPVIHMPCVNGGVAVGIGLDYLFARWQLYLHRGDVVYMPMEEAQYVRTRAATDVGPDAAIMFRHDWHTLAALSPDRWLAGLFAFDLRFALMAPTEAVLLAAHFHDPRPDVTGTMNAWGDHVGHTAELAMPNQAAVASLPRGHASAEQVRAGYGTSLIVSFINWANANGVHVIGGLPTEFADHPMPDTTQEAIRSVYFANGADFIVLPNFSRYPRSAFFDSAEHLNETWQAVHSRLLAEQLRWHRVPIAAAHPDDPTGRPAPRNMPTD